MKVLGVGLDLKGLFQPKYLCDSACRAEYCFLFLGAGVAEKGRGGKVLLSSLWRTHGWLTKEMLDRFRMRTKLE